MKKKRKSRAGRFGGRQSRGFVRFTSFADPEDLEAIKEIAETRKPAATLADMIRLALHEFVERSKKEKPDA